MGLGGRLMQCIPSKFQERSLCIVFLFSRLAVLSTNIKQIGCIEEIFSLNDVKKNKISLFHGQVVAVKRYYPVLPAVPKNSRERSKTVPFLELHNDCDDKLYRGWNTDGDI